MPRIEPGESDRIQQVIERLRDRYPLVAHTDLDVLVQTVHHRYADCRVHEFVPLLVEKVARQIISRLPVEAAPGRTDVAGSLG